MHLKAISISLAIFLLVACGSDGGGNGSNSDGGGTQLADLPTSISWTEPQANTDASMLVDLVSYRFYYGSSPNTLNPVTALDLPANSANPPAGAEITHVFTASNIAIMTPLVANNTTHYFAMTAINSKNTESSLSGIIQYIP